MSALNILPDSKWNLTAAAHLLNRAGFGGTPEEVEKIHKMGLAGAVSYFVDYEKIPADMQLNPDWYWLKPDPNEGIKQVIARYNGDPPITPDMTKEEIAKIKADLVKLKALKEANGGSGSAGIRQALVRQWVCGRTELRNWWLQRMAFGPRPFQEKMVLFLHSFLATGARNKVKEAHLMWLQNSLFREKCLGNWEDLIQGLSKDAAMLIWLDNHENKKDHPNENYARELMELFTLGEGNYTEKDVLESARAFTGWTLDRVKQCFVKKAEDHDDGEKTFLGLTGKLDGEDIVHQIIAQPQAARFYAKKLWSFFASENPSDAIVDALASEFRKSGNVVKPVVQLMFSSEEFYAPSIIGRQVKSPIQWLVNSVRLLGRDFPSDGIALQVQQSLGQEIFEPPSVKGWEGGFSWINTNTLLARYNCADLILADERQMQLKDGIDRWVRVGAEKDVFWLSEDQKKQAASLIAELKKAGDIQKTEIEKAPKAFSVTKLIGEEEKKDSSKIVQALERRFMRIPLPKERVLAIKEYLDSQPERNEAAIRHAIRLMMSTPEYQLT